MSSSYIGRRLLNSMLKVAGIKEKTGTLNWNILGDLKIKLVVHNLDLGDSKLTIEPYSYLFVDILKISEMSVCMQ